MKFRAISLRMLWVIPAVCASTVWAQDQKGPWSLKLGVTAMRNHNQSSDLSGPGTEGIRASVTNITFATLIVGYEFDESWRTELFLTNPQSFDINGEGVAAGLGTLAKAKVSPPTWVGEYRFGKRGDFFRPGLALGLNYNRYSSAETTATTQAVLGGPTSISLKSSTGLVWGAGFDLDLGSGFSFSALAVKIRAKTTATLVTSGSPYPTRTIDVTTNPVAFNASLGYRF